MSGNKKVELVAVKEVLGLTGYIRGGVTVFGVLIPDVNLGDGSTGAVHTVGVVSVHRGTSNIGPGQLETYTTVQLTGTAANRVMPLVKPAP